MGSASIQATTPTSTRRQRKPKKGKSKPGRKGWGPFNSVLKERSVDFNLTLDVQNMRQEIQQLTITRDLLQSRVLQLRHSPTGSLMQTVREFFRVFREGLRVEQQHATRRRRAITQSVQSDFLSSVLDQDELNSALGRMGGVAFMVEQFRRYSLLLRMICLKMDSFEIVLLDDNAVMVQTKGTIRFQVLRETVMGIFPHVLGNEWLCARLIGAEVEAPTVITFDFNATDRICGYEPDVDHVTGFSKLLGDPNDVSELLGRARIGVKSTIGVAEDGRLETVDVLDEPENEDLSHGHTDLDRQPLRQESRFETVGGSPDTADALIPSRGHPQDTQSRKLSSSHYHSVVGRYMLAFASGWWPEVDALSTGAAAASSPSPQQDFLRQCVSPHVVVGPQRVVGHKAIERAWQSLCARFDFVGFHATSQPQLDSDDGTKVIVSIRVVYDVAIDISTVQAVFPHILGHHELVQALLDADVSCPSDLQFEWHSDDTLVARLREKLDWDTALKPLLPDASDRAFVLAQAKFTPEGYVEVAASANV